MDNTGDAVYARSHVSSTITTTATNKTKDNFLGVIGDMGPLATADFLRKLVENTPARIDQEPIPVLLYAASNRTSMC